MEKISLKEFEEKYMKPATHWDFSLFKIVCQKCGSNMVEIAGESETEGGYYGEVFFEGKLIVKCHSCGNAITKTLVIDGGGGGCSCRCGCC